MQKKTKIYVSLLFLIVFILISFFFGKKLKNTFHLVFSPIEKTFYTSSENASSFFSSFLNSKKIERENEELRKNNFFLLTEIKKLQDLKEKIEVLEKALSLQEKEDFDFIISDIISKRQDSFVINKGEKDGVSVGMAVVTEQGVLVGKITEALDSFSFLDLISKKGNTFDIKIEGVLGIATGEGDGRLSFQWVPQEEEIKEFNKVYTVDLGGKFPKGLLVGEIQNVENNVAEAFQTGTILPYFTEIPLKTLFIIKNFNEITP